MSGSEVVGSDVHRPSGVPAEEAPGARGEAVIASARALIAIEQAIVADVMVKVAAEAAQRAVARAKETAETAVNVAFAAAAEFVAEANAVAMARAIAATAATEAAERIREKPLVGIGAEIDATMILAQMAELLSEEVVAHNASEARLREHDAEATAIAGMIAHDLESPLRAVSGLTVILRRDLIDTLGAKLDVPTLDKMDRILAATEQMRHLVGDQLAFATARERTLNLRPVNLEAMIAEIVTDLRVSSPEKIPPAAVIDVGHLPTVHADSVMCRQLLENLIDNALKYVRPGRPACVYISATTEPTPLLPVKMVHVQIADQGPGIPPGQHEKLFAAFYRATAAYPGTGLGLAICRRVIDLHGGTIKVTDNPGGGSVFHFTLPAASISQSAIMAGSVPMPVRKDP